MKIIRAREGAAIDLLYPYLEESSETSRDIYSSSLKRMLENASDQTFILQAFEDEDKLGAFLIAFAGEGQTFIQVLQATEIEGLKDRKILSNLFLRLLLWADNFNIKELRLETRKGTKSFVREWITRRISRTLAYAVPDAFDLLNLEEQHAETDNKTEHPESEQLEGESETTKT